MTGIRTMRDAIDAFCSARDIPIKSPLAINAAYHLISVTGRERSLAELNAELDAWYKRHKEGDKHKSLRRPDDLL
jgi:hypothetical protein